MVDYTTHSFKALGSTITIQADIPKNIAKKTFTEIEQYFEHINQTASRFLPHSQLTLLNNNLNHTIETNPELAEIIKDAYYAYQITGGNFDPRIITTLNNLGYINTFNSNNWETINTTPHIITQPWTPQIFQNKINIGPHPIDLGGIGKSYTATKASHILQQHTNNYFLNAGGDIILSGTAPDKKPWTVGIENPYTQTQTPTAIIQIHNQTVATSSTAKNKWKDTNGKTHHHLINPKTGLPIDTNITAITVIHDDLTTAEIWSKSLFLETQQGITEITNTLKMPTLWFTKDKKMHYNQHMKPYITWLPN